MIKPFRPDPKTLQPLQSGPLAPHLNNFAALLTQQRYSGVTGWNKLRLISALSCWMTQKKVRVEKLNEHQIAKFLGLRWQRVAYHSGDKCTLALLLQHCVNWMLQSL